MATRGRPKLSAEEDERRLVAWRAGLNDRQIAQACGIAYQAVQFWRKGRGLPANAVPRNEERGVPMEEALPPEGCELVRAFLRALVTYANQARGQTVDVMAFADAWREYHGRRMAG